MARKLICFCLVLSIMVAGASAASAASVSPDPFIDIMSFGNISSVTGAKLWFTDWTYALNGEVTVNIALDSMIVTRYVDFVLYLGPGTGPTFDFYINSTKLSTSFFGPYNNYVRVYGYITSPTYATSIPLRVVPSTSGVGLTHQFLSFSISSSTDIFEELDADGTVYSENGIFAMKQFSFPSVQSVSVTAYDFYPFFFKIIIDEWESFDYVSVLVELTAYDLSSITVNNGTLPFEVSEIISPSTESKYFFTIDIDCSNADRTFDSLIIEMQGRLWGVSSDGTLAERSGNTFAIRSVIGSFSTTYIDPEIHWLKKIWNAITDGFNKLVGSGDQMDNFADNAQQQAGSLQDGNDAMNEMVKPDIDSSSADISTIIAPGDLANTTSWLSDILNSKYISQIMTLSLTLTLASYVLFGKKG